MKKYLLAVILFLSNPVYANEACTELSRVAQTIDLAHQSGMPKAIVKGTVKLSGIKTMPMKVFVKALIDSAYADERVENINKKQAVKDFSYRLYVDCVELMALHDSLK